ncbi:MAG: exopolysaccharide transport family protein [Isosphaeraceae bacterium]
MPVPMTAATRDLALAQPSATTQVTPRILLRGLSRHWWHIMLGWLVVSTPLAYAIYALVEPTFEAESLLRVEPTQTNPYNQGLGTNPMGEKAFLKTQVELITSSSVLDAAITKPGVSGLPIFRKSKDPKAELRADMQVDIVGDDTYLIRVSLASRNPAEAAEIVNAVVESYLDQHNRYHENSNRALKSGLESELTKLDKKIADAQATLEGLVPKSGNSFKELLAPRAASKEADQLGSSFRTVPESQYVRAADDLWQTDMKLLDARIALETARSQLARAQEVNNAEGEQRSQLEDQQREELIGEAFKKDPDAHDLLLQIQEAKKVLAEAARKARQSSDASIVAASNHLRGLYRQWDDLWMQKHDEIAATLVIGGVDQRPEALGAKVEELAASVKDLESRREKMSTMLRGLEIKNTDRNSDEFRATILAQDLTYWKRLQEQVKLKQAQLDFEIGQEAYRITVVDKAKPPQTPSNNKRIKLMAVAPVGVLALMLGLFLLMEIKSERVGDPEALSTRVQSEVYALPPLPTVRSIRRRADDNADDQIEQFIQRLDHLRFAVCGSPDEVEKGRCVLITSAIGGEGKTTLAAQLAARCGNAGMSTLLIDADLRRTGLCSLLDVPEGPGLSDALVSDEPLPTELVVPVQGGTFHLLPAGTPTPDTSRVLQNRKLGLLIAQFRQIYDLVIIDSPPVLPVPDALILGRWADGAVLAVRYDISRFPQVERARRQLDGAGVAVLGTVINGMKNSDSYYGRYSYGRRRSPQAEPPAAL